MTASPSSETVVKRDVKRFWESSPCGTYLAEHKEGTLEYYAELEDIRYRRSPYAYDFIPEIARFAETKGQRVLELGCGVGTDLTQFAKAGATPVGLDLTRAGVSQARDRFRQLGLEGLFVVGDAENLPFKPGSFDVVWSFGVIHHTPRTDRAVEESKRVLRDDGRVTIALYHKRSLTNFVLNARFVKAKLFDKRMRRMSRREAINYFTETNKDEQEGPINPLTKMYTRREMARLFRPFGEGSIRVDWIKAPFVDDKLPRGVKRGIGRMWGWYITFTGRKAGS